MKKCLWLLLWLSSLTPVRSQDVWTGSYFGYSFGYSVGMGSGEGSAVYSGNLAGLFSGGPAVTSAWERGSGAGPMGGLQIGNNFAITQTIILGIEGDLQISDLSRRSTTRSGVAALPGPGYGHFVDSASDAKLAWFGTWRARLGVASLIPHTLIYTTGGVAYGQIKTRLLINDNYTASTGLVWGVDEQLEKRLGWTAGGGIEWSLPSTTGWRIKLEYLFTDFGAMNNIVPVDQPSRMQCHPCGPFPQSTATEKIGLSFQSVRAGFNIPF